MPIKSVFIFCIDKRSMSFSVFVAKLFKLLVLGLSLLKFKSEISVMLLLCL